MRTMQLPPNGSSSGLQINSDNLTIAAIRPAHLRSRSKSKSPRNTTKSSARADLLTPSPAHAQSCTCRCAWTSLRYLPSPKWTSAEEAMFLPGTRSTLRAFTSLANLVSPSIAGFLTYFTRHVSLLFLIAASRTYEDDVLLSVLRLFRVDPRAVVLLLAQPYRLSIGQQAFVLARAQDADVSASDFLAPIDDNNERSCNYYKEVTPAQVLRGQPLVVGPETRGSYSGKTIHTKSRQRGYHSKFWVRFTPFLHFFFYSSVPIADVETCLQVILKAWKELSDQGTTPGEIKEHLTGKFRLYAQFSLGDPQAPRDPLLPQCDAPIVNTFHHGNVPLAFWSQFCLHSALETLNRILSGSLGSTMARFSKWRAEVEASELSLLLSLSLFDRATKFIPLMQTVPICPRWGASGKGEHRLNVCLPLHSSCSLFLTLSSSSSPLTPLCNPGAAYNWQSAWPGTRS